MKGWRRELLLSPPDARLSFKTSRAGSGVRYQAPLLIELGRVDSPRARRNCIDLFNYLEVGHRKHAMPSQLSGGEAQRVAIARALANRPRIISPTSRPRARFRARPPP